MKTPLSLIRNPLRSLPLALAQSRLKSNLFALVLLVFVEHIFTPYIQFRRGAIWLADEYIQGRSRGQVSWSASVVWWLEHVPIFVMLWNIAEAYLSIRTPLAPPKAVTNGLKLTPSRVSSPLTRAYPLVPSKAPSTPSYQTPTRLQAQNHPSSALARTSSHTGNTPGRSSPLSAATAKALDLPVRPRESTGLFYPEGAGASPSKVGRGAQGQNDGNNVGMGGMARPVAGGDEFVMVEREEKEWVENVWKGVKGKGGKVGI